MDEIRAMIKNVEEFLMKEHVSFDYVEQFEDLPVIMISISLGDWKHDHLRLDYLMEEKYGVDCFRKETTEEDGSDCYSAIHYYIVNEEMK